jgi:hypothetical protein
VVLVSQQTVIREQTERLWHIAYTVFEDSISAANGSIFANQGQKNDMQFALMNHLSALKQATQNTDIAQIHNLAEQVHADFLGLEMIGFISADTMQAVERIIAQIKE